MGNGDYFRMIQDDRARKPKKERKKERKEGESIGSYATGKGVGRWSEERRTHLGHLGSDEEWHQGLKNGERLSG